MRVRLSRVKNAAIAKTMAYTRLGCHVSEPGLSFFGSPG